MNASTVLMAESTNSEVEPPDNTDAVAEIRERIDAILRPAEMATDEPWDQADYGTPGAI
ncbi:hypothetical protein [Microbacterium sp. SA39]|uniref:hypothetical protein n=1 Tax=Microbacterium sp. SA39 TaxID=1263625 RepID=UPI0013648901|nr:hypothetical protein [Microbacterium sp. SA39]